jgi:hypothetical protein
MKRIFFWTVTFGIIVLGAIALLWERPLPPQQFASDLSEPAPERKAPPAIEFPLPEVDKGGNTLPALDSSDDVVLKALTNLQLKLAGLILPERIVRNIVVTVDNLPREVASERMRPVKRVPGKFRTMQEAGQLRILPANADRYREYVRIFEATEPQRLIAIYIQFYPLFQSAYQELGYPNRYFNDRLVAVIDHLLDAPDLDADVELLQPHVLYEFADPQLQQASAGHKVMMRIGPDNARRVKVHLKEIRDQLVAASEQVRSPSEGNGERNTARPAHRK